jgi:ketosteroid isomerase-like protein
VTREEIEVWVRYLWILKRDAPGSWKIARLIFNTDDSDSKEEGKDLAPKT